MFLSVLLVPEFFVDSDCYRVYFGVVVVLAIVVRRGPSHRSVAAIRLRNLLFMCVALNCGWCNPALAT